MKPKKTPSPRISTKTNVEKPVPAPVEEVYVSLVIPLLNEEESLRELYARIQETMQSMGKPFEVIFIDDGSTDTSFDVLKELHAEHPEVKAIRFRRNYGKSGALSVGFHEARGQYVITMDADLQDDPAEIPALIEMLRNEYDLVSGWKQRRHDPLEKTLPSKFFNYVTATLTGIPIHDFNCGLKAYKRDVVKEIAVYGELHRYIPVLAHWSGFRVGEKPVMHHARKFGKTKFGLSRYYRGLFDLLTVIYTTRFIKRPLHLFGIWGLASLLLGLGIDGYLSIEWLFGRTSLSNRPLFIVGILFLIVGVQFISLGLLGEMITKQQKDESYSIRETLK